MITRSDAARLLAYAAAVDNRHPSEAAAITWARTLGDLDFTECLDAIDRHRLQRPSVWLEPGHVAAIVKARREDTAARRAADEHHQAITDGYTPEAAHAGYLAAKQTLAASAGKEGTT